VPEKGAVSKARTQASTGKRGMSTEGDNDSANVKAGKKLKRDAEQAPVAMVAHTNGVSHASAVIASTSLRATIEKLVAKKGALSLAKLVKLVQRKHHDKKEATTEQCLEQVPPTSPHCVGIS
jgi:molybdopterin-guanine dinucleotide biosynthesis protein A